MLCSRSLLILFPIHRVTGKLILLPREISRFSSLKMNFLGQPRKLGGVAQCRDCLFQDGLSQDTVYRFLCYSVGLCCLSILYLIVCIWQFQTPSLPLSTRPLGNHKSVLCVCWLFHPNSTEPKVGPLVEKLTHEQRSACQERGMLKEQCLQTCSKWNPSI